MTYIVTAGGTGGHIYPALTIADKLSDEANVIFVASKNGIDREIITSWNPKYEVLYWDLKGFSREKKFTKQVANVINIFKLMKLCIKSKFLLKKYKPETVIGFGGYITFPVVKIAQLSKIKTIIHEQNSFPGITNRSLGKNANKIALSYMQSAKYFPKDKIVYTSNPRADIARKHIVKTPIRTFKKDKVNILVLGGSLGAQKINEVIFELANNSKYCFHLVVGRREYEKYKQVDNTNLVIYEYLDDALSFMKESDLVITRAGASTLLELTAMNKKTIAIPSPNVVANHQEANARELAQEGKLELILEKELTKEKLIVTIDNVLAQEEQMLENKTKSIDMLISLIKG